MTKPLKNARHERFAQELAKGQSADTAYTAAGYSPSRKNAQRLRTKEDVTARVAELQAGAAKRTEITVAGITARLVRIADKGEDLRDAPGLSVARASLMDAAKLNGLIVDIKDLRSSDGSMSPKEPTYRLVKSEAPLALPSPLPGDQDHD
ncbi:terminase small subunit [Novosphingobium sp. BL-8H]|uniref:terminase small subunit n=1 Tax=Novosphingobium sp. BL-8H TaxID=3127640 RepID=UPI0037574B01